MKQSLLIGLMAVGAFTSAEASLYSVGNVNGSGTSLALGIPDGTPIGVTSALTVSGADTSFDSVSVTLNISGGYNGDLYGYLSYNGTLVTLVNRVGTGAGNAIQQTFGFSTAGFNNVTLADGSANNIHNVANPVSLPTTYSPDGGSLASFTGDPNGTWTLYFADLSGGGNSTLEGWSIDLVKAVPEPANVALAIFGGLLGVWGLGRWRQNGFGNINC